MVSGTESNSFYLRYCKEHDIAPHPARFPAALPEYFIRMLTDRGDLVYDPFGGSCVTGEVAERLKRKWICSELIDEYVRGAVGRFVRPKGDLTLFGDLGKAEEINYKITHPAAIWTDDEGDPLQSDGGRSRPTSTKKKHRDSNDASS